jgi:hypothetical protein
MWRSGRAQVSARPARAGYPALRRGAGFWVRAAEAGPGPRPRGDADAPPALSRPALALRGEPQVVRRTGAPCKPCQGCSVEQATPAAGGRRRGGPAGQPASAQPLLENGDADAALAGELTPRGRPCVAGVGHLGTSIRGRGVHAMTLRLCRSTAN